MEFSATQCKDKYKYLKSKYTMKKDNMSERASGAAAIKFDYFEEMDEFLGNRHNITPIALASNLLKRDGGREDGRKYSLSTKFNFNKIFNFIVF